MLSKNSASEADRELKLAPYTHVVFAQVMKLIRANVSQLLVTTKFQEFVCDYLERVNPIQDAAAQVDLLSTLRYFFEVFSMEQMKRRIPGVLLYYNMNWAQPPATTPEAKF
jgi:hypothetical protein